MGATNKNKDIRCEVRNKVDERIENQLTIGMNLTINPVNDTFIFNSVIAFPTGSRERTDFYFQRRLQGRGRVWIMKKANSVNYREPVDKVYFRRRDEESMYAEAMFKNKIMLGKK